MYLATGGQPESLSEEYSEYPCFVCEEDKTTIRVGTLLLNLQVFLCVNCLSGHKKYTTGLQEIAMTDKKFQNLLTERCVDHPDEVIEHFCGNHGTLLCNTCERLGHKYRVSTVGIMMTLTFLVLMSLIGSGNAAGDNAIVGCLNYQFMNNGSCHPCSNNCKACASETNCTVCQKGFFGTVCEKNCNTKCTGTCHKQYGHCTYGCRDGKYPADDNSCQPCPDHCLLCETLLKCVLYKEVACRLSCHGNCTNCNRATGQCTQCHSLLSQHDTQRSTNDDNDNSTTNVTTIIPVIVGVFVAVGGSIAVFLFYRKWCSTNASIKSEPLQKVASTTEVVQIDLPSQILFQEDNTTDPLVIHCTEGSTFEHIVDGQDVNKSVSDIDPGIEIKTGNNTDHDTERLKVEESKSEQRVDAHEVNKTVDGISDIDPGIEVKTGKDTDSESDISDLDYDTKHEIKPTNTQRACSAHNESMFSVTTPALHRNPKRHRTRVSNPYPKPKYKDKSGKDHTQCRRQDTICKQEYTPILQEEQYKVKCSEMFGRAYYDQVERFTA